MGYDLIVIGGGPGGYVAAIKAAQNGLKVACIDNNKYLGGTCLNDGCIPSKILLDIAHKYYYLKSGKANKEGIEVTDCKANIDKIMAIKESRQQILGKGVESLLKGNKIDFFKATAFFVSEKEISLSTGNKMTAKNFLIATGSLVSSLPNIIPDEKNILSSDGVLKLNKIPEELIVIGGGYIGTEMASVWHSLGSKVTIVEFANAIVPNMDETISKELLSSLEKSGIKFLLNSKVTKIDNNKNNCIVHIESKEGNSISLTCNKVLISIGRKPNTTNLNLEVTAVERDKSGFIKVNDHFQTAVPHIYAIGDAIGGIMLAHKAEEEGIAVANYLVGKFAHVNYGVIPSVIYTHPEAASVGKSEQELRQSNIEYKIGIFKFNANSKARAIDEIDGLVKIIADAKTDKVLGCHIIGKDAGNLIHELAISMEFGASSEDIALTCHAHPTLNEAIREAAMATFDRPIHALK